jgi:glycosyltransferase involved in cell wall biosynthesis
MDLSILICTHNSGNRIRKTLSHILNQKNVDKLDYEVLIVDYKSTDNTKKIGLDLFENSKIPLKIIDEKKQGKTPALETGLYASKGNAICIVDDDNWIDENYISTAHKIINEKLDVGVIGAFGMPHCEIVPPLWFSNYPGTYAIGHQGKNSGYVTDPNRLWFWGAGSVFRKKAWLKAKNNGFKPFFNPTRGKNSTTFTKGFTGGEDPEMCFAIQICGYRLWYEPSLIYTHFIPKSRLTEKFILNATSGTAAAAPVLRIYIAQITKNKFLKFFRSFFYQNFFPHLLLMYYKYLMVFVNNLFNKFNNRIELERAKTEYLSQIDSLYRLRTDYSKIVKSVKSIKN